MKRGKNLTEILTPWVESLDLPGGPLNLWTPKESIIKGHSHWYTTARKKPKDLVYDDWVFTVKSHSVEVRDDAHNDTHLVIGWAIIDAADPDFFIKLEAAIRAAVDYLMRS